MTLGRHRPPAAVAAFDADFAKSADASAESASPQTARHARLRAEVAALTDELAGTAGDDGVGGTNGENGAAS